MTKQHFNRRRGSQFRSDGKRPERIPPPRSNPAQVRDHVRRFEPHGFLRQIGEAALAEDTDSPLGKLFPGPSATHVVLSQFGLADLARFVLASAQPYRTKPAGGPALIQGMNLINGLDDPLPAEGRSLGDWGIYLMRLGAKQLMIQGGILPRLSRMLMLFRALPAQVPEAARYDIPGRFRAVTGLSLEQFAWVMFVLHSQLQKTPVVSIRRTVEHTMPALAEFVNAETVDRTLEFVACSISEFKELAAAETAELTDPRQEHWSLNPLYSRPLIRTPDSDLLVAPVPRLVLERLVDAPYFELLAADGIEFTKPFGYVFETYVGWLLRPHAGDRLRPALRYGTDSQTADWTVHDTEGITQVEVKTGRLRKAAKTTGTPDVVSDSLRTHYGQAVRQLYRVTQRVDHEPELAPLRGAELHSMIVLLDPITFINSPVWKPLRSEVKAAVGVPDEFDPQVCSVDAIERLAPHLAERSLAALYRQKLADPDKRSWDWDTFVSSELGVIPNAELERVFDEFTSPIGDPTADG